MIDKQQDKRVAQYLNGFYTTFVKGLLKVAHKPPNLRFAPKDVLLIYNSEYIRSERNFVENKGSKILYIIGADEPWGVSEPIPSVKIDALKMVLKDGHNGT